MVCLEDGVTQRIESDQAYSLGYLFSKHSFFLIFHINFYSKGPTSPNDCAVATWMSKDFILWPSAFEVFRFCGSLS